MNLRKREIKIISVIRVHLIIVEDHLSVQPKNIYVPQQRVAPGIYASHLAVLNFQVDWAKLKSDSHLPKKFVLFA